MGRRKPNQRRFTQEEKEWMLINAPITTQTLAARHLAVRVTAVNKWAKTNAVKFLGSKMNLVKKADIPKKPVVTEYQDVDKLMELAEKCGRVTA